MIDQHNSLAEKFLKKWFWLYLFSFIIAPIWYIIKIIISGELTVSEVGILYWIISLIVMISAYNDLGMSESINHFIPQFVAEKRYDKVKTILVYAFIAQMSTGITIAAWFVLWADWLALNYFKSESAIIALKIFAFYFLGINVIQILSMFFSSIQNTFAQKIIELIRMWFTLIATIGIFFFDMSSLINYSYAWIIWLYLWIIFSIWIFIKQYYKKYFKNEKILWEKELFLTIFKYWALVFLWAQAAVILGQIDMQMIIYFLGTTDAGYYTNYLSIIGIPFMIIWPIFALLFPLFSEMHSKWESNKIALVKEIFTNNFMIIWVAFNFFFFTFALPITYVLFWEKFLTSGIILQYSVLFLFFNFLLQINFNILAGVGRVAERVKIISIAVIINIITNLIFIHYMWVAGAAVATGIGWIIIWAMSEYVIRWEYKISIAWKNIFINIFTLGSFSAISLTIFWNYQKYIEMFSRIEWFFILLWIGGIYFCIFAGINYSMFKNFILEVKKLKNG